MNLSDLLEYYRPTRNEELPELRVFVFGVYPRQHLLAADYRLTKSQSAAAEALYARCLKNKTIQMIEVHRWTSFK